MNRDIAGGLVHDYASRVVRLLLWYYNGLLIFGGHSNEDSEVYL